LQSCRHTRSKLDIVAELKKQDLNFSVRSLKAGDFLWIAQEKADFVARDKRKSARELVLDFIAERKRGDDLATSIKDGRYTCQKVTSAHRNINRKNYFRLEKIGLLIKLMKIKFEFLLID
jgi:ERCC4-type nuclease